MHVHTQAQALCIVTWNLQQTDESILEQKQYRTDQF